MSPPLSEIGRGNGPEADVIRTPDQNPEVVFHTDRLTILTGRANPGLAKEVGKRLQVNVDEPVTLFADGELRVQITHSIDRSDVFIIQSTAPPYVNDYVMELALMIDAAKRASGAEITAIIPYYGYSRQDRKEKPRVPISSKLVANILKVAGASRLLTIDLHSGQQQGFFDGPWDNLQASYTLLPPLKRLGLSDLVVVSPDKGGVVRATDYARFMGTDNLAVVFKQRDIDLNDTSATLLMIGDVKNRDTLLVDDLISTGSTLANAAQQLHEKGARRIVAAAAHGLFTGNALQILTNSPIEEVWVTNSIRHRDEVLQHPKIKVASVAPLLAEAISRIHRGQPLHELFR